VKKGIFGLFMLFFLITSMFQALPVEAQTQAAISLDEQNIILPGTDVELIAVGGNNIYAMVSYQSQSKFWLFLSENKGRSWKKLPARGLPEEEGRFIALEASGAEVVLTTTTKVFLSRDGGKTFQCLGGPSGLSERGEAISSLAISGSLLVGVWHPSQGKTPQEGVYLWSGSIWEWQGMPQKDVTAVGFLNDYILAVAADATGTYLQIGSPGQRTFYGISWNEIPDWPVEVAQTLGQSPREEEVLNSRMALSGFDYRYQQGKIYVIYNTRQRVKDDVYQVNLTENLKPQGVLKLGIPKSPELLSLDSIRLYWYRYSVPGILAVGVTTIEGRQGGGNGLGSGWGDPFDGAHVYRLSVVGEGCPPSSWESVWLRTGGYNTYNCQVAFAPDRTLFVGTSGPASCFGRAEGNVILPISLLDAQRGINQLVVSPDFQKDKTLFLNSGNRDILKVILGEDYSLTEAQRVLYVPRGFGEIKIAPAGQNLFIFERGTKRFWLSPSWRPVEKEVEIVDVAAVDGKIWWAGKDTMLYNGQRVSSGLNWIQKIEPGPGGKILVVGGVKEDVYDTISLAGEESPRFLPALPVSSQYVEVAYSTADKFIYCGLGGHLYQLTEDWETIGGDWQKVKDFERIYKILTVSQGLYVFCQSKVYFSAFPITKESEWTVLGGEELKGYWSGCQIVELAEKQNLLILWESSRIVVWTHQISEKPAVPVVAPPAVTPPAGTPSVDVNPPTVVAVKSPPRVFVREVKPEDFPQGAFVPVVGSLAAVIGLIYWVVHSTRQRKKLRP